MNDGHGVKIANTGEGLPDSPKPPRVRIPRLTSIGAVRRELTRQYGAHLRGEVGNKALMARVRTLTAIRETFLADEIEARLREEIELIKAHLERRDGGRSGREVGNALTA